MLEREIGKILKEMDYERSLYIEDASDRVRKASSALFQKCTSILEAYGKRRATGDEIGTTYLQTPWLPITVTTGHGEEKIKIALKKNPHDHIEMLCVRKHGVGYLFDFYPTQARLSGAREKHLITRGELSQAARILKSFEAGLESRKKSPANIGATS